MPCAFFIYMCVYTHVCIYVCIYVYACVYIRMHLCTYLCMDIRLHACTHICVYVCVCDVCICTYIPIFVCVCMYVCVCDVYACVCICISLQLVHGWNATGHHPPTLLPPTWDLLHLSPISRCGEEWTGNSADENNVCCWTKTRSKMCSLMCACICVRA